jgi:hypothetical protein
MDWCYSQKLNTYISLKPLKISPQIIDIIRAKNVELEWDDYGNICNIDFDDAKTAIAEAIENLGIRTAKTRNLIVNLKIEKGNKNSKIMNKSEYDNHYTEIYKDDNFIE